MYAFYLHIIFIYYIYKICLLIKFAPDPFSILTTSIYTNLHLSILICRPWTSLGNTVFMQIVFSYNYERLIRSISTPNKYTLFLLIFLLLFLRPFTYTPLLLIPSIRTPLFYPSLLIRSICTYIRTPLLLLPLFLLSTTLPFIYIHNMYAFFSKNFSKKISTPKAYPKIFPKFLLIIITPPLYSSIGK